MKKDINQYWKDYKEIYSFEEILKIFRERKALEFMNKLKPKKVLEIGCGFSPLFNTYKNFSQFTVVEPGGKAFNNAIKRSKENDSIRCINDYFENSLDILKKQNYDFITSTGVLHETETPELFLKNIGKLSNMKTIIYLNVPNAKSLHRLIAQEAGIIKNIYEKTDRNKLLSQNNIFCKDTLKELITKTLPEFKIKECKSFFIKPFTHNQMMECVDQKIVNEKVIDGLYEATKYLPELGCELYCIISKL